MKSPKSGTTNSVSLKDIYRLFRLFLGKLWYFMFFRIFVLLSCQINWHKIVPVFSGYPFNFWRTSGDINLIPNNGNLWLLSFFQTVVYPGECFVWIWKECLFCCHCVKFLSNINWIELICLQNFCSHTLLITEKEMIFLLRCN